MKARMDNAAVSFGGAPATSTLFPEVPSLAENGIGSARWRYLPPSTDDDYIVMGYSHPFHLFDCDCRRRANKEDPEIQGNQIYPRTLRIFSISPILIFQA